MFITEAATEHNAYSKSLRRYINNISMPIRYKIGVHLLDVTNYLLNYDKIVIYHVTLFHKLLKH